MKKIGIDSHFAFAILILVAACFGILFYTFDQSSEIDSYDKSGTSVVPYNASDRVENKEVIENSDSEVIGDISGVGEQLDTALFEDDIDLEIDDFSDEELESDLDLDAVNF